MMYPPKKKAFSPDHKQSKQQPHIVITSKFGGTGGSNTFLDVRNILLSP